MDLMQWEYIEYFRVGLVLNGTEDWFIFKSVTLVLDMALQY